MIELRWVKRTRLLGMMKDGIGYTTIDKVLQFRVDISATQGVHFVNKDDRMSPWQDVPEVDEPSPTGDPQP